LASTIWAPAAPRSSGASAFTEACVPTGMKIGVSTTPVGGRQAARARGAVGRRELELHRIKVASPYE
jgi:hypothetical protein